MESEEDESLLQHPKRSKPLNPPHFPSNSVLPMPNLPPELITEILLRLPVKSLLKFRSVSKSWLSLIASSEFVKTHLLLSANNKDHTHHRVMFNVSSPKNGFRDSSLCDFLYNPVTESAFYLDFPGMMSLDASPELVGSVNGLICLAIDDMFDGSYELFIWNPSIRKYKQLPKLIVDVTLGERVDSRFGFAYDELQDDYKVVGIFPICKRRNLNRVVVKVYSLKRDSWRRIDDFQGQKLLDDSGKFFNGKLHWLDKQHNIISIDPNDEKWAEVEQSCYFKGCGFLKLGGFESDLSVFCSDTWTHLDVWVMKEYGVKESWTKLFTIKPPENSMGRIFYSTGHTFYPIILMSNEGEFLIQLGSRFTKYYPKDDSIRIIDVTNSEPFFEVEIYVNSLVCPILQ